MCWSTARSSRCSSLRCSRASISFAGQGRASGGVQLCAKGTLGENCARCLPASASCAFWSSSSVSQNFSKGLRTRAIAAFIASSRACIAFNRAGAVAAASRRAGRADGLGRLAGGVGEFIQRGALLLARSHRCPDLLDGQPRKLAEIVAANLRQRWHPARPAMAHRRHVAGEFVLVIGRENGGIDVAIAVAPKAHAVAPERVVDRRRNTRTARTAGRPSHMQPSPCAHHPLAPR